MFKKIAFAFVGLTLLATPLIASADVTLPTDCSSNLTVACLQTEIQQLIQILTQLIAARSGNGSTPTSVTFTASPTSGGAPLTVEFDAGGITPLNSNYTVKFGDGSANAVIEKGVCGVFNSACLSATHTYTAAGTYTAQLIYQPASTCSATSGTACPQFISSPQTVGTVTVTVTSPVASAALYAYPTSGQAPLSVLFTSTNANVLGYTLSFGDGSGGSNWSVDNETGYLFQSHTYTTPGTYTATLPSLQANPWTLLGSNSGASATVTVTSAVNSQLPTLSLTALPSSITAGQSSTLSWSSNNTQSCSSNGTAITGTIGLNGAQIVSPTQTTLYTISCSSASGHSVSQSVTVTVTPAICTNVQCGVGYHSSGPSCSQNQICVPNTTPSPTLSATPSSGQAPISVQFNSNVSGTISFGDGTTAQMQGGISNELCTVGGTCGSSNFTASHTYSSSGNYTATLSQTPSACPLGVLFGSQGCTQQNVIASVTVTVSPPSCTIVNCATGYHSSGASCSINQICVPNSTANSVSFSAWPTSGAAPLTSYFTISNASSASGYSVTFGDGQSSSSWQADTETAGVFDLSHTYTSAGTYSASLVQGAAPCASGTVLGGAFCSQGTTVGTANVTVTGSQNANPGGLISSNGNLSQVASVLAGLENLLNSLASQLGK